MRQRQTAGFVLVGILLSSAVASAAGAASGTFTPKDKPFKVVDAFAFEGKAEFGDETVVSVRLFGQPLDRKALEAVLDFEGELDRQRSDAPYVTLEIEKGGRWSGSSYQLPDGNCGFCSDGQAQAKAKLRIENGTLRGTIKVAAADYMDGKGPAVDLSLDVPIAQVTGASPLPADGGEPGKLLTACLQATKKRDRETVVKACLASGNPSPTLAMVLEMADEGFWSFGDYAFPGLLLDGCKIAGGRVKGEWAELLVEGKQGSDKRKGSIYLRRVAAGWRYDHERLRTLFE